MTKKIITAITLFILVSSQSIAQVIIDDLGNGTYQYTSLFSENDLEFFLFGDGYHTFQHNPRHQFKDNAPLTAQVVLYHSVPYDDDEPDEHALNLVTNGVSNPIIESIDLQNKVELKTSWNLVNDRENYYLLMFENNKPWVVSGCIEFHFDIAMSHIIEPNILDDYNNNWVESRIPSASEYPGYTNKYKWNYTNLEPGEQRFVYIPAKCLGTPAQSVNTMAIMKEFNCTKKAEITEKGDGNNDDVTDSDFFTLTSFVSTNPHDPNCIVTETVCFGESQNQTVRYRVYFQNEGEEPAINVGLDFHINAPFVNVKLIEASDNCILTWTPSPIDLWPNGIVRFDFNYIFLEGTGQPNAPIYEETVGWVEFDVCYGLYAFDLVPTLCADNRVDIFFDNEAPISAFNEICKELGCTDGLYSSSEPYSGSGNSNIPNACDGDFEAVQYYPINSSEQANVASQNNGLDLLSSQNQKTLNSKIEEVNLITEFKVYPNPALNQLYIDIPDSNLESDISIYNANGQIVMTKKSNKKKVSLNIEDLHKGVYYITLVNSTGIRTNTFVKL